MPQKQAMLASMNQRFGRYKYVEEWNTPKTENDSTEADLTVFMFHGYGADCEDLRSLASAFKLNKNTHWIFPNGPLSVPIGPGWSGSAWWNIDFTRFERPDDMSWTLEEPKELPKLREELLAWIPRVEPDWKKVVIGGFSQGSMLAMDLFLNAPVAPKGLILLSSALINRAHWTEKAVARAKGENKPIHFFQSHGKSDAVLPFKVASQLETMLIQSGWKGSLTSFQGGHEIPMSVIEKAAQYLKTL